MKSKQQGALAALDLVERFEWLRDHYHGFEHYRIATGHVASLDSDVDEQIRKATASASGGEG